MALEGNKHCRRVVKAELGLYRGYRSWAVMAELGFIMRLHCLDLGLKLKYQWWSYREGKWMQSTGASYGEGWAPTQLTLFTYLCSLLLGPCNKEGPVLSDLPLSQRSWIFRILCKFSHFKKSWQLTSIKKKMLWAKWKSSDRLDLPCWAASWNLWLYHVCFSFACSWSIRQATYPASSCASAPQTLLTRDSGLPWHPPWPPFHMTFSFKFPAPCN